MQIKTVCWDWNGTLLDDVEICRVTMNQVLREWGLDELTDRDAYRRRFTFPIRSFYAAVGIADHEFAPAAHRYLELLAPAVSNAPLRSEARATIAHIHERGMHQVLASATLADPLNRQMAPHALGESFDEILSIDDALNASKHEVIANWIHRTGAAPQSVVMVGDTNHDHEIAASLGTRFVHYAGGHQELTASAQRIDTLDELLDLL
ncbi:HAD family hydrolase [Paramicrobacterium fandaimingii]|uniref:HAD family hydrolase n=1 Tax=Paramicrobacterium fandaimingii TaxID=2708079 RepID=UPI001423494F|nr:HAD hydrolase-like protein [Microbacterium fandaimingii]